MAVYYKFKSAKDYDSIPIEGQFISVANLKERIFETKHLGRGTDFDLMVSNAQTNEEYVDEAAMIPKNTSVLIRRVPGRPRKTITNRDEHKVIEAKVEDTPAPSSMLVGDPSTMKYIEESEWDEFGNDLYAMPDVTPALISNHVLDVASADNVDEDSKIKALIETPALDWNRQSQDAGRGFGRGMGGRTIAGRGFGRGGLERKTPPAGYVCHRCKVPGHFIQHCPTNGDPNYDIKRVKPPTGIPKSMLVATPDGSYALPSGAVAVLKPNEAAFEKEVEGLPTTRPVSEIPSELRCPLCKEVMKDAVLTSKCCFRSFCDKCIRDYIISKSMCVCGATNVLADDLLPNRTVRETLSRMLEATTSSTENVGSQVQVQDMESALPALPRVPSPTLSAASKDETKRPTAEQSLIMMDDEGAMEAKTADIEMGDSEKKVTERTTISEAAETRKQTMSEATESKNKEPTKSQESAPMAPAPPVTLASPVSLAPIARPAPEDIQEKQVVGELGKKKKKKKARLPGSAADMQWKAYQDFGPESYPGMPLPASGFNPYWAGGMPMGMDGYLGPFGGPMPYMGYQPGPFDIPFGGGIFQQDPFVAQGYMMPTVPRDLSELGMSNMGNMGMNQGHPPFSREEMEARRADARHRREMEWRGEMDRHVERERVQSKDRDMRRESRSISDVSSIKNKPKLPPSVDRSDRPERSERPSSLDRHGPSRPSPSRHGKRKASTTSASLEQDYENLAIDAAEKWDKKQKASVFSRISFPAGGEGSASKKRKTAPSSELPPVKNGVKEHYRDLPPSRTDDDGYRDEWKGGKSSSRRAASAYEHDSSEEEYHFKRRPSSSSRGSKEREPHDRGGGGHEHGRERASKRRGGREYD